MSLATSRPKLVTAPAFRLHHAEEPGALHLGDAFGRHAAVALGLRRALGESGNERPRARDQRGAVDLDCRHGVHGLSSPFAGMNRAAGAAGPLLAAGIELLEERRQIVDDAAQLHLDAMNEGMAGEAIPFEAVDEPFGPLALDHQADAARDRPLRRMADMRRQQEDIAGMDRQIARLAVIEDAQRHVARDLIEKFLERVVVIIGARVRPADDGDDEIRILPDLRVADRRLQ